MYVGTKKVTAVYVGQKKVLKIYVGTALAYTAGSLGLAYSLSSNGTYYILTGIGECTDTDIIIPSTYKGLPVTVIQSNSFQDNINITSVKTPQSVTNIGYRAFYGCRSLNSIVISNGVKSISSEAFMGCVALKSVVFENPNGWTVMATGTSTDRTPIDVSDPKQAADDLTSSVRYTTYYWIRE